jgi:hypothetical protein
LPGLLYFFSRKERQGRRHVAKAFSESSPHAAQRNAGGFETLDYAALHPGYGTAKGRKGEPLRCRGFYISFHAKSAKEDATRKTPRCQGFFSK